VFCEPRVLDVTPTWYLIGDVTRDITSQIPRTVLVKGGARNAPSLKVRRLGQGLGNNEARYEDVQRRTHARKRRRRLRERASACMVGGRHREVVVGPIVVLYVPTLLFHEAYLYLYPSKPNPV